MRDRVRRWCLASARHLERGRSGAWLKPGMPSLRSRATRRRSRPGRSPACSRAAGRSGSRRPDPSFWMKAGGNGSRTSSKWWFAITASRSGFGRPFLFVLPSFARPNIVSISFSNWSAGLIAQRNRAAVSDAFQNLCAVPGSTVTDSPAVAVIVSPPTLNVSSPSTTSKTSVWYGWRWAEATKPFGSTRTSITTRSPSVSAAVSTKRIVSPVMLLWITSPVRIITVSLSGNLRCWTRSSMDRRTVAAIGRWSDLRVPWRWISPGRKDEERTAPLVTRNDAVNRTAPPVRAGPGVAELCRGQTEVCPQRCYSSSARSL